MNKDAGDIFITEDGKEMRLTDIHYFDKVFALLKSGKLCGWWNSSKGGPYLQEFEKRFAEYIGTNYAYAVSNGSSAIYVALRACKIEQGCSVAVSPYTHIGSVAPIVLAGAKPVFVDVDNYGNIDAEDLAKVIKNVQAVVVPHQLGQPSDMERIKEVAGDVPVIEDCSQSLGAEYGGKKVGSIGDIGCFSIGGDMTKTISTGEGGIVTTNNEVLANRCRNIRNHGEKLGANYLCFNFRLSDLQALVGLMQMDGLQRQIDYQVSNAKYLVSSLPVYLKVSDALVHTKPVYYIIGCRFIESKAGMSRDGFIDAVKKARCEGGLPRRNIGLGYSKLVYEIPFYSQFYRSCPNAERIRGNSVWIDWHRYPITVKDIDRLLKVLRLIQPC